MKEILLAMAMLLPLASFAQEDAKKQMTKYEEFTSKSGAILKFVDIKMPKINLLSFGSIGTSIRTIISDNNAHFFRLEKEGSANSDAMTAMIDYSDLVEINKVLTRLSSEADADLASDPDYLVNEFVTIDSFVVGYYINKGISRANWFLHPVDYSGHIVIKKETLIETFKNAQAKIEELMAAGK